MSTVRCLRCHRILTDEESIKQGMGPVCSQRKTDNEQLALEFDKPGRLFKDEMSQLEKYRMACKVLYHWEYRKSEGVSDK